MPPITLELSDAMELGQLLAFLTGWLSADRQVLQDSLAKYVGHPGYDTDDLQHDLRRFAFLIGETDGEGLFTPDD